MTREAEINLKNMRDDTRARLTTWIVNQHRLGVECPTIDAKVVDDAVNSRNLGVSERADRLLELLCSRTDLVGESLEIVKDTPIFLESLAWSESFEEKEVDFLLSYLAKRDFIVGGKMQAPSQIGSIVSVEGHVHLARLREAGVNSKQGFVAMWFDPSMDVALEEGIYPGIRDAGYKPLRIDRKAHNNRVDDELIAEIRRSRFVVADFTQGEDGARGGVYYEAGFAAGLNIPVIFTCRSDAFPKVHFDTRQYPHIVWTEPADLRKQLSHRISATISDGPLRQ